ncbi:MAG: hypothetical protein ACFCVF_13855, partial [Kineosporiaceae bacterium]
MTGSAAEEARPGVAVERAGPVAPGPPRSLFPPAPMAGSWYEDSRPAWLPPSRAGAWAGRRLSSRRDLDLPVLAAGAGAPPPIGGGGIGRPTGVPDPEADVGACPGTGRGAAGAAG